MRAFHIHGSLPPEEKRSWRKNTSWMVLAETAKEALDKVLAKHPEADIHNVHHLGERELIT